MSSLTLSYHSFPGAEEINAIDAIAGDAHATICWMHTPEFGRAYALVEDASERCVSALRERAGDAFNPSPLIALAIVPSVDEALPPIIDALYGRGGLAGVKSCVRAGDAIIVEWDLERTGAAIVLDLVDVEIARFHARRVNHLLTPLPIAWSARIASEGLGAPEISRDRVLEALLKDAYAVL